MPYPIKDTWGRIRGVVIGHSPVAFVCLCSEERGVVGDLGDVVIRTQPHLLPQLIGRLVLALVAAHKGGQQLAGLLPPEKAPVLLREGLECVGNLFPAWASISSMPRLPYCDRLLPWNYR